MYIIVQICSLLRGGIAERGGVRVGHRIIEINNQSVVAVPHEKIVNLLATSVGEVTIILIVKTLLFLKQTTIKIVCFYSNLRNILLQNLCSFNFLENY